MPESSLEPRASNVLVSSRPSCPLCASSARREIDSLISSLSSRTQERVNTDTGEAERVESNEPVNYQDIFDATNRLLAKIPENKTAPFELADLILHAHNHPLVTQLAGIPLKSEGALLFAGGSAFDTPDLKDFLRFVIVKAVQKIETGELKITPTFAVNATALLWRMSGTSGDDEFLKAMHDKVTSGTLDDTSPLGKAYQERQNKLNVVVEEEEKESA